MSQKDKIVQRLLSKPKDFTKEELRSLMSKLGFTENVKGKTSGSRIAFNKEVNGTEFSYLFHDPHPRNYLLLYQIKEVINLLKEIGEIDE